MKQVFIMPNNRGISRTLGLVGLLAMLSLLGACEEGPTLQPGNQPVTHGEIEFEIGTYEIRYLELSDESGETFEYPDPVLVFPVVMTNKGTAPFEYRPTHSGQQISEATTPLMYPAPTDPEASFRQNVRSPLNGVYLQWGSLAGQITAPTTIAAGESITDLFLYELPDPSVENWILSIPPTMHRAELPLFLSFRYREPTPTGFRVYPVGTAMEFEGVAFTVTGVTQEYLKLEDVNQGAGYSTTPVLKVAYKVENQTDETVSFDPGHRDLTGRQGAILHSSQQEFQRARFPATAKPEGQLTEAVEIEAGESVEDYAIFERPNSDVPSATFELAASHFGRAGRVRVSLSYEEEEVAQPAEMAENDD